MVLENLKEISRILRIENISELPKEKLVERIYTEFSEQDIINILIREEFYRIFIKSIVDLKEKVYNQNFQIKNEVFLKNLDIILKIIENLRGDDGIEEFFDYYLNFIIENNYSLKHGFDILEYYYDLDYVFTFIKDCGEIMILYYLASTDSFDDILQSKSHWSDIYNVLEEAVFTGLKSKKKEVYNAALKVMENCDFGWKLSDFISEELDPMNYKSIHNYRYDLDEKLIELTENERLIEFIKEPNTYSDEFIEKELYGISQKSIDDYLKEQEQEQVKEKERNQAE